jgi:hypothetical protein
LLFDPCVGIRATPIAKAMLAMVLMIDHAWCHRAQCGNVQIGVFVIVALVAAQKINAGVIFAIDTARRKCVRLIAIMACSQCDW